MDNVLDLQRLGQDNDGKDQAADGTVTTTWTVTTTSTFISTISQQNC